MPTHSEHQQAQALLRQLRTSHDAIAYHQAAALERAYYDREMAALSTDIYDDAKGVGQPPPGWVRGSEHLDLLHHYAPQIHLSDAELIELLKPKNSGFRADIYLPHPSELGPGYQPTVVFKGSSGQVLTANGLRDTTLEDFGANNGPQSIGMKTDYYTRAMILAASLKSARLGFALTGHSLGGGLATAASAVTGMPATVFNAAALHPETARRFARENPGVELFDLDHRVNAYEVRNELLTSGVQKNLRQLPEYSRQQLATGLQEISELVQRLPDARAHLQNTLQQSMPLESQAVVNDFIARLASGNVTSLLRDIPPPVGEVHVLSALTERDGRLVPRTDAMPLEAVTALATPLLSALNAAARGAKVGAVVGDIHAKPFHAAGHALSQLGDGARAGGELAGAGMRAQMQVDAMQEAIEQQRSEAIARHARETLGTVQAGLERGLAHGQQLGSQIDAAILRGASHLVPEPAQAWFNTQADQLEGAGNEAAQRHQQHAEATVRAAHQANIDLYREQQRAAVEEKENQLAADTLRDNTIHAGQRFGDQLDKAANKAHTIAGHVTTAEAAAVGMAAGVASLVATTATVVPVQHDSGRLDLTPNALKLAVLANHVTPSGAEAFDRHLMQATVLPSMAGHVQQLEHDAQQSLQRTMPARAHDPVQAMPDNLAPGMSMDTLRDALPHALQSANQHRSLPANASVEQIFDHLCAAMETGDEQRFQQALTAVGRTDFSQEFHAQAAERVDMQDRQFALEAQLQRTQEQLIAQQTRSHAHVMTR